MPRAPGAVAADQGARRRGAAGGRLQRRRRRAGERASGRTIEGRPTAEGGGGEGAGAKARREAGREGEGAAPAKAVARPAAAPAEAAAGPPAGAKKAALPPELSPQLATLVERAAAGRRLDLRDQVRRLPHAGPHRRRRRAPLHPQRQRLDASGMPALVEAVRGSASARPGSTARSSSPASTARPTSRRCRTPSTPSRTGAIVYYLFDLPYCAGHDLRQVPLVERRAILAELLERAPADGARSASARTSTPTSSSCCRTPAGCASRA